MYFISLTFLNRIEINKFFSNSEEAVFPKSSNAGLPDESVNSNGGVVHDKLKQNEITINLKKLMLNRIN